MREQQKPEEQGGEENVLPKVFVLSEAYEATLHLFGKFKSEIVELDELAV